MICSVPIEYASLRKLRTRNKVAYCLLLFRFCATAQGASGSYLPAFREPSRSVIVFPESGPSRKASFDARKWFSFDAGHSRLYGATSTMRNFEGGECGSVPVDAKDRSHRVFRPGTLRDCVGLRSPDDSKAIYFDGKHLHFYDLRNQTESVIGKIVYHPRTKPMIVSVSLMPRTCERLPGLPTGATLRLFMIVFFTSLRPPSRVIHGI